MKVQVLAVVLMLMFAVSAPALYADDHEGALSAAEENAEMLSDDSAIAEAEEAVLEEGEEGMLSEEEKEKLLAGEGAEEHALHSEHM